MAVGKGSMERAAKTITKTKTTAGTSKTTEVKTTVIAKPVQEKLLQSVAKEKKNVSVRNEAGVVSVSIGEEMPVYFY